MNDYPPFLVWVDLETTGLEPAEGKILEIGVTITNPQLDILAEKNWLCGYPRNQVSKISPWALDQHMKSGLLEECFDAPYGGPSAQDWDMGGAVVGFIREVTEKDIPMGGGNYVRKHPMCGASVHFDRAWLKYHMPKTESFFYYGNMDVSSIEKLYRLWYPGEPQWEDRGLHRVLPDNQDAINELKYYINKGLVNGPRSS